jgi:hypothetical protein
VTENTSESAQRPIPFELPEYDRAFAEFIYEVANALALANSTLLREIPRMSSPAPGASVVTRAISSKLIFPSKPSVSASRWTSMRSGTAISSH